jgi:hypothetical protein
MAKGTFIVESSPNSDEELSEYHRWYDEVHPPEMLRIEGIISARKLASLDGESFLVVYESRRPRRDDAPQRGAA